VTSLEHLFEDPYRRDVPIHDDHWPGTAPGRRHEAARAEERRVAQASITLRRIAGRVRYDDGGMARLLAAAAALGEASSRHLRSVPPDIATCARRLADAVEDVAGTTAPPDEPLPP
jgi:hypothetical protein